MKKAVIYLSIVICSALFAFSCQSISIIDEETTSITDEEITPAQPEGRTFTCVFAQPDPDSKVNVDLTTGKTTWQEGDKILINAGSGGTSRRTVTLTASDIFDEGKKATITIPGDLDPYIHYYHEVRDVESTFYAMYPADNVASGNLYYNQAFSNQNDFLMAACNVDDTFVFYNLCGVIAYTVNDGEEYDFDQVVFAGKDGETVAYETYQARVRDTGSGAEVDYAKPADSYKPLAPLTSCTNSVVSDGTTMNYIFLPGGTNFTTGFTFSFLSGGEIKKTASANVSNAVKNIAPGYILKLGDISSHLKNYVAPSSHNATHPEITGATDLSAGGTANSYIVDGSDASNKGKVFKFKAYKGNTSNGVGVINSVEIVWETWDNGSTPTANSVIKAVDFDKQSANDYYEICFQMPTESLHAGNALIAAKNAGGDIIWSWHIWVPSTTIENVDGTNICGATIMDRNLGALEVTPSGASDVATLESLGLMYQWGRKDPFPGARALEKWPYSAKVAGTDITVSDAAISMAYAIAHPTVYGNSGGDDWQDVPDDARWTSSKNVNDPCPPGYKIPYAKKDSKPLWNTSSIATAVSDASLGWEVSTTGYWVKISDGANVIVIPLAGYVEENGDHYYLTHVTDRGALWFVANTTSKYHVNLRTEGTYVAQGTQAARGCGIRCVVE